MPVARTFAQAAAACSVPLLKAWPASARTWNRPTGPALPSARVSWKALAIPPSTRTREQTHSLGRGRSQARTWAETAEAPHVYYLQPCARHQLCAASWPTFFRSSRAVVSLPSFLSLSLSRSLSLSLPPPLTPELSPHAMAVLKEKGRVSLGQLIVKQLETSLQGLLGVPASVVEDALQDARAPLGVDDR